MGNVRRRLEAVEKRAAPIIAAKGLCPKCSGRGIVVVVAIRAEDVVPPLDGCPVCGKIAAVIACCVSPGTRVPFGCQPFPSELPAILRLPEQDPEN